MEMSSLEPAVTQAPLGRPRMPCSSTVDEIGGKNADQAHAHTRAHTPAVFSYTDTHCTLLRSGLDNEEKAKSTFYGLLLH